MKLTICAVEAREIYYASMVDMATMDWLFDNNDIGLVYFVNIEPLVDLMSHQSAAKQKSEYPCKSMIFSD